MAKAKRKKQAEINDKKAITKFFMIVLVVTVLVIALIMAVL